MKNVNIHARRPMTDRKVYLEQASKCFNTLATLITADLARSPDFVLPFWHVGRVYDTCSDYIANAPEMKADLATYKTKVVPACLAYFDKRAPAGTTEWWWDDYGWWGLAHLAAGSTAQAWDCFVRMQTNGLERNPDRLKYLDYRGGCWNHRPDQNPAGCQNCVTNSAFFLLGLRLLRDPSIRRDPSRRELIIAVANGWASWFSRWQGRKDAIENPIHLLRERPVGDALNLFASGQPTDETGWVWAGDQGLMVGWAAESFELSTEDRNAIYPTPGDWKAYALQTAIQIRTNLAPLIDVDGVVHDAPFGANSWGGYRLDYCTGRGVLMQHLARADQVFKAQPGWVLFAEHARQTADFVIDCLNQADQAPMYSWNVRREQAVLDAWCELVHEGSPRVCNGATIAEESSGENLDMLHLIYSGTALDALTAGLAATP